MNIKDFLGTFTVRQGTIASGGVPVVVEVGNTVEIAHPTLNQANGNLEVQMTVSSTPGQPKELPAGLPNPMTLTFVDNRLHFVRAETGQERVQMFISVSLDRDYRALYSNIVAGDPQQAGVWGADDDPETGGGPKDRGDA